MAVTSKGDGLRTLLIDNFDSYTFNLHQQLCNSGAQVVVIRNNVPWEQVRDNIFPHVDNVVISPGPGTPTVIGDFGCCHNVILHSNLPVLGVCLGHQGMATALGGKVCHAPEPMHGRKSLLHHNGMELFAGINNPFSVVRYHSLIVDEQALPSCLQVTAWTKPTAPNSKRIIMALKHKERPLWGVQFHPESICTDHGLDLISNFMNLTRSQLPITRTTSIPANVLDMTVIPSALAECIASPSQTRLVVRKIENVQIDSESVFKTLFANKPVSFWLDSARVEESLSRFSFMGSGDSERSFIVNYSILSRKVTTIQGGQCTYTQLDMTDTFFGYMARLVNQHSLCRQDTITIPQPFDIPFDLMCGFVGYFGYEMKTESLAEGRTTPFKSVSANPLPDAAFIFSDRLVVFDHIKNDAYIVMLENIPQSSLLVEKHTSLGNRVNSAWLDDTLRVLQSTASYTNGHAAAKRKRKRGMTLDHTRDEYIQAVSSSQSKIIDGESYEVCLTTRASIQLPKMDLSDLIHDTLAMHHHLRNVNPTPHASFINFGQGMIIVSASPEEFVTVDRDKWVQARPIKGTIKRDKVDPIRDAKLKVELEQSEKNIAENLMIVDLLRNDLNLICTPSSVCVPSLFKVESYASIHTMVSTIKGSLRPGLTAVDAVMKCFPPGSMTGAPKRRTVEILEDLEKSPRGVYSGALGYFSLTGEADFAVVIRTAIIHNQELSVGAGGAIVSLSSPTEEYDEMLLKLSSVLPSISHAFGIDGL
ncbi:hypothetical protein SmJEL517_g05506 [Synchytrium microbalum]|uniref:Anthranilate synthase component 2 n=1 Tax=Synchytrium microbalum TaxID=1806994 RepID=A0A507BNQ9_9FUNG|nr:uncharacterized protein SmJEL517_g05506 [Synchytrium microbalum]TPX31087.1 hypothetical protein SmJEL517_g05506 [Synchytrium microbalum]